MTDKNRALDKDLVFVFNTFYGFLAYELSIKEQRRCYKSASRKCNVFIVEVCVWPPLGYIVGELMFFILMMAIQRVPLVSDTRHPTIQPSNHPTIQPYILPTI